MTKYDLNAPAFGEGAQKVTGSDEEVTKVVEEEIKPEVVVTEEASAEESKVPYSRFKKFHDAAKEAEAEVAYWKDQAQNHAEPVARPNTLSADEMPAKWVKLYGDSEASQEAWQVQQQLNAEILANARQEALEAVRNERYEEVTRTEQNVEVLDDNFEDLGALVGRDLTDAEQSAVLDIVDDYTPKDRNGNYAGEILPFEKAWEIYELKTQAQRAPKVAARDNVARLSGNQTQGDASNKAEQDKAWNPFDWNSYQKRI